MQRRIQRAFPHRQHVVRRKLDPPRHRVAVRRSPAQRLQDQQVESAAQDIVRRSWHRVSTLPLSSDGRVAALPAERKGNCGQGHGHGPGYNGLNRAMGMGRGNGHGEKRGRLRAWDRWSTVQRQARAPARLNPSVPMPLPAVIGPCALPDSTRGFPIRIAPSIDAQAPRAPACTRHPRIFPRTKWNRK